MVGCESLKKHDVHNHPWDDVPFDYRCGEVETTMFLSLQVLQRFRFFITPHVGGVSSITFTPSEMVQVDDHPFCW